MQLSIAASSFSEKDFPKEEQIPVEELIILQGELAGIQISALKDDGCITNVVSTDFVRQHGQFLELRKCSIPVSHSNKDTTKVATQLIMNGKIRICGHDYINNWAVVDCRYDVLLGMPWHTEINPKIYYSGTNVMVDGKVLPKRAQVNHEGGITVGNLGVKKFRSILRTKTNRGDVIVYQLCKINNFLTSEISKTEKGD